MTQRTNMQSTSKKKRNHIAADLRTPKYRKKVVANKKTYQRKRKHTGENEDAIR